jgi:hypothetical protein
MVEKIKWIFYVFQGIFGLQINFSKTELIPLNISSADANFYCNILQSYQIFESLVTLKKLNKEAWLTLINTFQCRLDSWKDKFLSMGGRLVMLNSVLSSLSLYFLSIYRIPKWVLVKIDRLKRNFLWARVEMDHTKKYILVSWGVVCLHKEQGGMRVLNLDKMNAALFSKWI